MARVSLNDLEKYQEQNRRVYHKRLIKEMGKERAKKTIKKDKPPYGYTLDKYVDELVDEIAKEAQN